jgi:hypothetical protein
MGTNGFQISGWPSRHVSCALENSCFLFLSRHDLRGCWAPILRMHADVDACDSRKSLVARIDRKRGCARSPRNRNVCV